MINNAESRKKAADLQQASTFYPRVHFMLISSYFNLIQFRNRYHSLPGQSEIWVPNVLSIIRNNCSTWRRMQSLIVVKASSLSSSLTCRTLPENSLNSAKTCSSKWAWDGHLCDQMISQMTAHVLHRKSTTHEVSAISFHFYVDDPSTEKKTT